MLNHYTECNIISRPEATRKLTARKFLSSLGNFPSRIDKSTLKISRMSQRPTFGIQRKLDNIIWSWENLEIIKLGMRGGRLFYKKIVKRRIIEVVRLQIKFVSLKIYEHIEPFKETIANHAVYIPFALHPRC